MRAVLATLVFAVMFVATAPAQEAPPKPNHLYHQKQQAAHQRAQPQHIAKTHRHVKETRHVHWFGRDIRPAQWCGWFMRQIFRVADREYNRAALWAHWGRSAAGPRVGAVVVWWHHVGLIEGGPDKRGQWLVRSGNDGHAVRTRYLSIAKAIAFRMP